MARSRGMPGLAVVQAVIGDHVERDHASRPVRDVLRDETGISG
jgi:hypothetical protein